MSIYALKPKFQNLLRPLVRQLAAKGVTANQVTLIACLLSILLGVILWIQAVFSQKVVKAIKDNILLTKGVYAVVRNPIYSAFFFVFTGMLLIEANLWLLILPIVFWLYMTILLKLTEEKWLKEAFGQEYNEYCAKVNRVFPWFPKK